MAYQIYPKLLYIVGLQVIQLSAMFHTNLQPFLRKLALTGDTTRFIGHFLVFDVIV